MNTKQAAGSRSWPFLLATATAVMAASPIIAQNVPSPGSGTSDDAASLGEIVVTAERRSELQRDVPIAIVNIGADQLQQADARDLSDIAQVAPALRFDGTGPFVQPTIRGVGTAVATTGGGANVGIYIDGFYSPNPLAANFQLLNVQDIQVLKGPQGTLFGRNTTGGAILVNTAAPSTNSSAIVEADYSRFNTQRYQAYATTGLTDKIAVDIEGLFTKGDGFEHNIYTGQQDPGAFTNWSVRAGLKFDATENLSFLLRYEHQGTSDPTTNLGSVYVSNGRPLSVGVAIPGTVFATAPDQTSNSRPVMFGSASNIVQLTSTLDLSFGTLTSYTQGRFENSLDHYNLEASSASYFSLFIPVDDKTLSQEFLLTSKAGSRLQWTTGVFLFDYDDKYVNVSDSVLGRPYTVFANSGADTRSYAVYGDATYEVYHNLFLTAGARYSNDSEVNAFFTTFTAKGPVQTNVDSIKTNTVTPRAVLRYKTSDFSSVYASFSQGYKAPLMNVGGGSLSGINIAAEHINAYEVGFKYGRGPLSVDLAAYHYDYKDLQVAAQIGTRSLINNAADARISGLDGQILYKFGFGLDMNLGAAYTDAKYSDYPDSAAYVQCLNVTTCGASYGVFAVVPVNASGNQMQRAPEFTGNLGGRYSTTVADGTFAVSANLYHTSGFFFDSSNDYSQKAYSLLDSRVDWTDPSKRYTVGLFGDNLTNTHYLIEVPNSNFGQRSIWGYPRTYGVSLRLHL
jgi:iron complex outermembrane recepter protein